MARTIRARKSTSSTTLDHGRGRNGPGRGRTSFLALGAVFFFMAAPAAAENTITTLLSAVPVTGASASVGMAPGQQSADYFLFQTTYPAGVTVKIQASCDGTTWDDQSTWSASGKVIVAPNVGGCLYRVNVSTYAGVSAFTGSGLNDVAFSGTYSGSTAGAFTVEVTANTAATYATGTIVCVAKASLVDGETVTLDDGPHTVVFEFDVAGDGVTGGRTAVDVSTDTSAIDVAARLHAAINGVVAGLTITSTDPGTGTLNLANDVAGTAGNVATADTVTDAGFSTTGMSGADNAFDTVRWRFGSGAWTTGVRLTGAAQLMASGVSFTAAAASGHTIGDLWTHTLGGVSAYVTASGSAVVRTQ